MAVELSYHKGSVTDAAKEMEIDSGRISKWRVPPRYNGGTILPKNDKLPPDNQEIRELKKRLRGAKLENAILKKAVAIFPKGD